MDLNIGWTRQKHVCSNEDEASFLGAEVNINKIKDRLSVWCLNQRLVIPGRKESL